MEIDDLEAIIDDPNKTVIQIIANNPSHFDPVKFKQYEVANHDVNNKAKRQDKRIFKPNGKKDDNGLEILEQEIVRVNRLPIPLQKVIVKRSAAFLVGGLVKLDAIINKGDTVAQGLYEAVKKTWRDNKLQYKNKRLAKLMMSETECAELWYSEIIKGRDGKEVVKMRMNILAPSLGDILHPVFNASYKMIAFGHQFKVGSKLFFNLYTDDTLRKYSLDQAAATGAGWQLDEEIELPYGKIPIIYYSQENPEWFDVQQLINRLEVIQSNHGDTNDYNGSPILKLKGKVQGMVAKGEAGKAFQMDENADVDYVTWDNAPASIKMEMDNLRSWIFGGTQVPDLSPEFLKGLGDISGAALDRLLIDAHLKAKDMQDDQYGECVQRRVNFLISACISIDDAFAPAEDLEIVPVYSLFRIDDEGERIANATLANGGKPVMSQETSVAYAGQVSNPEEEWLKIKAETDAFGQVNA